MFERLIVVVPLWVVVVGYLGLRRGYSPRNLLMVGGGFALMLGGLAYGPTSVDERLVLISAIAGGLIVRGGDAERRRAREERAAEQALGSGRSVTPRER